MTDLPHSTEGKKKTTPLSSHNCADGTAGSEKVCDGEVAQIHWSECPENAQWQGQPSQRPLSGSLSPAGLPGARDSAWAFPEPDGPRLSHPPFQKHSLR